MGDFTDIPSIEKRVHADSALLRDAGKLPELIVANCFDRINKPQDVGI